MLEVPLEIGRGTLAGCKEAFKVSDRLQQRIGVRAFGRPLLAAKPGSQSVQTAPQFSAQRIEGLQGKGQAQLLRRGFEREPGQQLEQPRPQPAGSESVARQNVGKEKAEAAPTAATLAAIATPHPLAALTTACSGVRIIAVKLAVAV
jgi:hypothetical protein